MFKKFTTLQVEKSEIAGLMSVIRKNEEVFESYKFAPPSATEKERAGFSPTILDGKYVSDLQGDILIKVTQQGKSINKNEIKDLAFANEIVWMEENKEDSVPKNVKKAIYEDAELLVIQKTYPKEAVHGYVLIRKDGLVLVEGKGNAAEKLVSLVRKAIGSFPAFPVQVDKDVNDMLKGWVKTGLNGDVFTLGAKATLMSEQGTEYNTKGEDISQDPHAMAILKSDQSTVTKVEVEYDGIIDVTITDELTFEGIKIDKDLTANEESDVGGIMVMHKEINKMVDDVLGRLKED